MPKQTLNIESAPVAALSTKKEECRIFISRKTSDAHILGRSTGNRKKLRALANGRLTFFDAANIDHGQYWRQEIHNEIRQADILLLILTRPAQNDYDWLLYEAGLFDMLKGNRKLICIYPEGTQSPDQLRDKQGVEAKESNILNLLQKIFTDKEFTNTSSPLNPEVPIAFADEIANIAKDIAHDVSGVPGKNFTVSYVNPFIRLVLPPNTKSLGKGTKIESNKRTLRSLFQLQQKPQKAKGEHWTWDEIRNAVDLGNVDQGNFNVRWMQETESMIESLLIGKADDRQIKSRFIGKDKLIWRPEIEIWRTYENGKTTVDITFSPQQQELWLKKARAPVALAANLNLAVRVRHELIDFYLRRLPRWQDGDADHFSELEDQIETIEREGFFIRWQTQDVMLDVFDLENSEKVDDLETDFGQNIHSQLHDAVNKRKVRKTIDALKLWRINNAKFLSIGMPRYMSSIGLDK